MCPRRSRSSSWPLSPGEGPPGPSPEACRRRREPGRRRPAHPDRMMPAVRRRLHAGAAGSGGVARGPVQPRDATGAVPVTQQVSRPPDKGWPGRTRDAARAQATRLESATVGRFWSRLLELEFVDRSVALAAKAVVSFFPLLIVAAALSPPSARRSLVDSIATRFGIHGDAFEIMKQAFASPDQTRAATGLLGGLLAVAFAVSFTTALQRTSAGLAPAARRRGEKQGSGRNLGGRRHRVADAARPVRRAWERRGPGAGLGGRVSPPPACGGGPRG